MAYPIKATVSKSAQKAYDKAFCEYLEEGHDIVTAAEMADMFLLEWSKEIDLPDAPECAWTGEEPECYGPLN